MFNWFLSDTRWEDDADENDVLTAFSSKNSQPHDLTMSHMCTVERLLKRLNLRKLNDGDDISAVSKWFLDQARRVSGYSSEIRRERRRNDLSIEPNPAIDGDEIVLESLEYKLVCVMGPDLVT